MPMRGAHEGQFEADVVIVGAGIAGASLAAKLGGRRVAIVEREAQPGFHATGRSAAIFSATYGSYAVRRLTRATLPFLRKPPADFSEHGLLEPRAVLFIAREDQLRALHEFAALTDVAPSVRLIGAEEVARLVPILKPGYAAAGVLETDAYDIDVNALHAGYLRQAKANGTQFFLDAGVTGIERKAGHWVVHSASQTVSAPILVNAAGAWVDEVASLAGLAKLGFQPRRRTAVTIDAPEGQLIRDWPFTVDIDEQFYFKPEVGALLLSPADETESEPCDSQPDELDVAVAIDRFETATTVEVRRVRNRWSGLRTFSPDRSPVIGFDHQADGFFWLAGQGGYGIQTSDAAASLAAWLILDGAASLPTADLREIAGQVSPARFEFADEPLN